MARCEAFAYWACSTIKLAVARLTNKSKTIRAVRVLRECQDNEIAFECWNLHFLDTFLKDSGQKIELLPTTTGGQIATLCILHSVE